MYTHTAHHPKINSWETIMARPFTDIRKSISGNEIKNGTLVTTTSVTGRYVKNDTYVSNVPSLATIQAKYGYRFYNGIFVDGINGGAA